MVFFKFEGQITIETCLGARVIRRCAEPRSVSILGPSMAHLDKLWFRFDPLRPPLEILSNCCGNDPTSSPEVLRQRWIPCKGKERSQYLARTVRA